MVHKHTSAKSAPAKASQGQGTQSKSFKDKLKDIRPRVQRRSLNEKLPSHPGFWRKDGEDHINVAVRAETPLGRSLSLDHKRLWTHDILGQFRSLNSVWYFLLAVNRSDAIRHMTEGRLKESIKRNGGTGRPPKNFRAIMADAIYQYTLQYDFVKNKIKNTDLPFDWYRTIDSGVRVRFRDTEWLTAAYEEIRAALKASRQPDFTFLLDDRQVEPETTLFQIAFPNATKGELDQLVEKWRQKKHGVLSEASKANAVTKPALTSVVVETAVVEEVGTSVEVVGNTDVTISQAPAVKIVPFGQSQNEGFEFSGELQMASIPFGKPASNTIDAAMASLAAAGEISGVAEIDPDSALVAVAPEIVEQTEAEAKTVAEIRARFVSQGLAEPDELVTPASAANLSTALPA